MPPGRSSDAKCSSTALGSLHVLDRLQEDDRVAGRAVSVSTSSRSKRDAGRACTCSRACSWASGFASTPVTVAPRARPARRCRSPRRRPCPPRAGRRSASAIHRRRPGGAGTSSSPPARPGSVRSPVSSSGGTPAGWSRWTCCRRTHGGRAYTIVRQAMSARRSADGRPDPRRQRPLPRRWRPRTTTPSGGSTTARGRAPGASGSSRRRSAASRRAIGARSRSAPAPATSRSTCCAPGVIERGGRHRHLAGHARACSRRPPASLGLEVETVCCEAPSLPFADESFDLVFGHAVLHHLPDLDAAFREFRRVLRPGGTLAFWASRRARRPPRRVPKRGAHAVGAALAARCMRRRAAAQRRTPDEAREEDLLEQVVDVHAFTPGTLAGHAARRRLRARARERRGAGGQPVRLGQPRARGDRRAADESRAPGACSPTAATSRSRRSTARCSSRACRRRSSTTC